VRFTRSFLEVGNPSCHAEQHAKQQVLGTRARRPDLGANILYYNSATRRGRARCDTAAVLCCQRLWSSKGVLELDCSDRTDCDKVTKLNESLSAKKGKALTNSSVQPAVASVYNNNKGSRQLLAVRRSCCSRC
jgi:hypothetical protein